MQSIWQLDHKFRPIDGEGNVIEADYTPDHPILLIVGEGAPENITALMKSITDDQNIFQRIIIDLRFPNKVIVKLGKMTPEERKKLKDVKERRI